MNNAFEPKPTDRTVYIPITFSKRSEGQMDRKTLFWIILTSTIAFVLVLTGVVKGDSAIYVKIPLLLVITYVYTFFFRFFVFREGRISDAYETMKENDYELSTNIFWNIYDVGRTDLHVAHFANGLKGIYVQFDKDVIVGKKEHMEFEHFRGISNMYNVAHGLGLDIIHLDYMDSAGSDERMDVVYASLNKVENPELKSIMTTIYANLEKDLKYNYTSYDVYLFTTRGRVEDLWYNVRQVIEYGLKANYSSYFLANPDDLRRMPKTIMNLETFSLNEAEREVIKSTVSQRIRPIRVIREDSSIQIINKKRSEILQERKDAVSRTRKGQQDDTVETSSKTGLLDLFEGTSELDSNWTGYTGILDESEEETEGVEQGSNKLDNQETADFFEEDDVSEQMNENSNIDDFF